MLKYEHLLGRDFRWADQNCYTLLRDFYRDNYGIELTDYANPGGWTSTGMNLYGRIAAAEGFDPVHDHFRDWRPGDVVLCAIQSQYGSHIAIVLNDGQLLHHLVGQLSCVTPYRDLLRNTTVGVYRHRDVPLQERQEEMVSFVDLLPPHIRRRLQEAGKI